jgi:hypothetical protein
MFSPIDFIVRFVNPPAQPRDPIDYVIKQIKEVPQPPEREPKEGKCDIRNPGAACLADMQEDLDVTAATPELPFPYWDVAESATDTEAVGHPEDLFPQADHFDQLANNEVQQNVQADSLTGHSLTNAKAADFGLIQMHHDDGIQDGYLDVIQADSITGETTNTENVGDMSGGAIFTGGAGTSEPETLSPFEFDVAAPLLTDQPVMGAQLEAVEANVCQQLEGLVPKSDLPFGCN